jgi:hypothetical protein
MVQNTSQYETVVALYPDFTAAQTAVDALVQGGFDRNHINIISNDVDNRYSRYFSPDYVDDDNVTADEGAGFGAVVGALTGLAVALVPGIGPVLAVGPAAAALISAIGAGTGAVTGGLAAGLMDMGVEEAHAQTYTEFVRRGGTIVAVETTPGSESRVEDILTNYGAVDVEVIDDYYRESGWTGYKDDASIMTSDELAREREYYTTDYTADNRIYRYPSNEAMSERAKDYGYKGYDAYDPTFRQHWSTNYGTTGRAYDVYMPAYHYGYQLATMPRYYGYTWDRLEAEARNDWGANFEGAWEDFKDAVRHAWNSVTNDDESYHRRYNR